MFCSFVNYHSFSKMEISRNDYIQPLTHTEYKYKSVQTGSADVPYKEGSSTFVGPDHNQTKSYLAKIDTTVVSDPFRFRIFSIYFPKFPTKKNPDIIS